DRVLHGQAIARIDDDLAAGVDHFEHGIERGGRGDVDDRGIRARIGACAACIREDGNALDLGYSLAGRDPGDDLRAARDEIARGEFSEVPGDAVDEYPRGSIDENAHRATACATASTADSIVGWLWSPNSRMRTSALSRPVPFIRNTTGLRDFR